MRKTFGAIDRHVDADSAYVPMNVGARGCSDALREIPVDEVGAIDRQVRAVDPDVVVYNHRHRANPRRSTRSVRSSPSATAPPSAAGRWRRSPR